MGSNLSVPERVYRAAKDGDAHTLQVTIQQLHRQGANVPSQIEWKDSTGHTPLIVAAARGNFDCVDLLLRHGATHQFTRLPEGSTALHEAVSRGHSRVVELLLQYGASPFVENARGLTAVDIAINKGNVAMVRALELRSRFTGTLQLKVPKFMGLGAEWRPRWCVIMPRYPFPGSGQRADQVARLLLVCYKANDQCVPCCKVWLDGALARSVIGSKGSGVLQCALSLHRNHALANGAHMTGDPSTGYTMHLRPAEGSSNSVTALRAFMEIVNGGAIRAGLAGPAGPSRAPSGPVQPRPEPAPARLPAKPVAPQIEIHHQATESDEDMARRLQSKYNSELEEWQRLHPQDASSGPSSPIASYRPNGTSAGQSTSNSTPAASAVHYPVINPSAPPMGSVQSNGVAQPSSYGHLPQAAAPPASAGFAPPPSQATSESGPPAKDDDESSQCVICMDAKATAGFLHGDSVHRCACAACAKDVKESVNPICPMCRKKIDLVVLNFY